MTLRHGRPQVAIPGPSIIPDRVLAAMSRPMPNIYEGPLVEVSDSIFTDLPKVARTDGEVFVVIGNGHAAWQMAVSNTVRRGDTVLVLESGTFAMVWGTQVEMAGARVETLHAHPDGHVDPAAVEERLRADADHAITSILVVLTDTATGVRNDIPAIRAAIDAAGHPALLMVDAIASLGCDRYEMDDWGVDVTVAATQKGLMTPPGLGFVWANEKALAAHERADARVSYFDWESRRHPEAHYMLYNGTPPISHLYALREALDMLFEEGLDNAWHRHAVHAEAVWAAVDAWGEGVDDGLRCNIVEPARRSHATTTIATGTIDADRVRALCEDEAGLTLGLGIGGASRFRIGHMGHLNPPMLLGTLGTVEAALHAIDAPIGRSGVAAAAELIGDAIR